jgi:hypothetical protein
MTQQKTFKKIAGMFAIASFAFSVLTAQALTVSPARAELTADPGETIQDSFLIINEQENEQTFYTSVEAFESQGESGTPNFIMSKEGLPSWVQVESKVTLKKGERVKVPYSVSVPKGAESGGHFAAIFLSTVPPATGEGQVSVGAKVGMLVLLKVTGPVKEEGGLLSFVIKDNKKIVTNLPIDFVYRFNNAGNDRVSPEGKISIRNMIGMDVGEMNANTSKGNILPGSVRKFEVTFGGSHESEPKPDASFFQNVSYQMNNFALGAYFASLDVSFGASGKASSSIIYFVLPWHLLTLLIVILLVLVLIFSSLIKRYNKWIIKQARAAR